MKKYALAGGALLLVVALAVMAAPLAAAAQYWGEWLDGVEWPDGATWEQIVTGTHTVESDTYAHVVYGCRLGIGRPPSQSKPATLLVVPQALEERILRAVDADDADTKIVYLNRVKEDLYSALVLVTRGRETDHVEVIIEGERTEVRELEPILIDETLTEEIIIKEFEVQDKDPAAPAKVVEGGGVRRYELHLTHSSLVTVTDSRHHTLYNLFGWKLARVTAKVSAAVDVGVEVLGAVDLSYTTTAWGWSVDWFNSSAVWSPALASVSATANFDGPPPLRQDVTLSTWVGVCWNAQSHP